MKKFARLFIVVGFFIGFTFVPYGHSQNSSTLLSGSDEYKILVKFPGIEGPEKISGFYSKRIFVAWSKATGAGMELVNPNAQITGKQKIKFKGIDIVRYFDEDSSKIASAAAKNGYFSDDVIIVYARVIQKELVPIHEIRMGAPVMIQSFGIGERYTGDPFKEKITLISENLDWTTHQYDAVGNVSDTKRYSLSFQTSGTQMEEQLMSFEMGDTEQENAAVDSDQSTSGPVSMKTMTMPESASDIVPRKAEVITPQKSTGMQDTSRESAEERSEPRFDLFKEIQGDTDRPGNNYRNFDLPNPDPDLCLEACQKDSRCRAFTYVNAGIQGPKARCWLKDAVPPAKTSAGCISGVKR